MSPALGRLIISPSTTPDLSLHRRNNHGGEDAHVSAFGLGLCSDGGNSTILPTRSSFFKPLKRFPLLYFRRQSFPAAVIPAAIGSTQPQDYDFDQDGLVGGDGGDGGNEDNGGGGGGGDGESGLRACPLWWWWWGQWLKQRGSGNWINFFKYNMPIEMAWWPEEETAKGRSERRRKDFVGKVKKSVSDMLNAILKAILTPFLFLAIVIVDSASFRRQSPSLFTFFQHFEDVMLVTMQLVLGTALLLTTLLLRWIWRRRSHRGGDSAGEDGGDRLQDSGQDSGDEGNDEL
ncbi:hypothetical protein LINGRAHAP2_LOCUS5462 [Linum grandiflorum]